MGSKTSGDRDSIKSGGSHSRKNSINAAEQPGLARTVSKEAHKLHGKTDPNAAINEAQPSMEALTAVKSLASIREIQFRDSNGNLISEPDASNPSRPKFERPLDTIRGFEERIRRAEREERAAFIRADSESSIMRRGSYYGSGSNVGAMTPRSNQYDSYYGSSSNVGMNGPKSVYRASYNQSGYFDGQGANNGYSPSRQRIPRTQTEPMSNGQQINYQGPYANQPSYETITNGSGSGSSAEPLGYQTDPSSDNSSFDRTAAGEAGYNAGYTGMNINGHYPNVSYSSTASNQYTYGNENGSVPPPPPHKDSAPRTPIKLGTGTVEPNAAPGVYEPPKPQATKRKSWLSRKFSTKG